MSNHIRTAAPENYFSGQLFYCNRCEQLEELMDVNQKGLTRENTEIASHFLQKKENFISAPAAIPAGIPRDTAIKRLDA